MAFAIMTLTAAAAGRVQAIVDNAGKNACQRNPRVDKKGPVAPAWNMPSIW